MSFRLKYVITFLLMVLFPWFAFAEDTVTMSFTPPSTDESVMYLENLFGVVDGVLHGTGSQIMGVMLGVFNAAVLTLGGIVLMYIILVSTMNTAHEGNMLGQKWSSIWVPIRATIGLALLFPKASGYCMMQIFVMWVVVQGVGVADKIWSSALEYLNVGGVIIQANMSPDISTWAGGGSIAEGAANTLYAQVCMEGIQVQLESQRNYYLSLKENNTGPCYGDITQSMDDFCSNSVPDFINSVDAVSAYDNGQKDDKGYYANMPNFDTDSIYNSLTAICGKLRWNPMSESSMDSIDSISTLSEEDMESVEKSRAAAVQQMYISLSSAARQMVNNDPQLNGNGASDDDFSTIADDQFGVAYQEDGSTICSGGSAQCPYWGADPSSTTSVLLQGSEIQDAIADYNAVMSPVINLLNESGDAENAEQEREFIQEAEAAGWLSAGRYFFDLVLLNGNAKATTDTDTDSGVGNTEFFITNPTSPFTASGCDDSSAFVQLCEIFNKDDTKMKQVVSLIDGSNVSGIGTNGMQPLGNFAQDAISPQSGAKSSCVYGYVYNGLLVDLGEQDLTQPQVIDLSTISMPYPNLKLEAPSLKAPKKKSTFFTGYITYYIVQILYDFIVKPLIQMLYDFAYLAVYGLYMGLIYYPLSGYMYIFQEGVNIIAQEGVNPILALAKMGVAYITFAMDMWVLMGAILLSSLLPLGIGAILQVIVLFFLPLFLAWEAIMVGIGFITAYFVPLYPFMIFTFGTLAWLMTVIEAMVASPIVALGIAHPEGHDALGKSETGFMILLNVFLRPGMMIVGYIGAISLSYVSVWILNAGFDRAIQYVMSSDLWGDTSHGITGIKWASIFGLFFSALLYSMLYMTMVIKAFTLIAMLPDKVLRWIGGAPESTGQETLQWSEETKGKVQEAGGKTFEAGSAMQKKMTGYEAQAVKGIKDFGKKGTGSGGNASAGPGGT